MGWLDRWKEQPKDTQLDLLGEDQALVQQQRLTGAISNKLLAKEVKQRGGTKKTHAAINAIVTQEMLGCDTEQLYETTGGRPGHRDTLPLEAQEALQVGDVAARHEMVSSDAQGDLQLKAAARRGCKPARKLFPW